MKDSKFETLCVMQPTYLPWSGYFNLIASADIFVFLDDVQFSHQSWQQRNRILLGDKVQLMTVPVLSTMGDLINEINVDDTQKWRKKHIGTLNQAYHKHPYGKEILAVIEPILLSQKTSLAEINIQIIQELAAVLGFKPTFVRSSTLQIEGQRSQRIANLCRHFGTNSYLSPIGAQEYLEADGIMKSENIRVQYQDFQCAAYPQKGTNTFVSHLSILDLLANLGLEKSGDYVKKLERGAGPQSDHMDIYPQIVSDPDTH